MHYYKKTYKCKKGMHCKKSHKQNLYCVYITPCKGKKKPPPKSCVCQRLKEERTGTNIRVYYVGGQIELSFEAIEKGCIVGQTLYNSPIYIDCKKVIGYSIISEVCPPGWLRPGDTYNIEVVPNRTIQSIEVLWKDGGINAKGELFTDEQGTILSWGVSDIQDTPGTSSWASNYTTTNFTKFFILISVGCANIINVTVNYAEEWISIAPGASYPLPSEPSEISKISFEAKTDPGTTSTLSLFIDGSHFVSEGIGLSIETVVWEIGQPVPTSLIELKNTGDYTIYIRNLVTE